jgi:uncharacterized protein YaiI (UPF0178 family)
VNQMVKNVCKINISLADQPLFVSIADQNMSMDAIIQEAIRSLNESGRAHESQQIAQLYKDHTIMSKGKAMSKGSLFKELPKEVKEINGEEIHFAEIDLIRMHQGGL